MGNYWQAFTMDRAAGRKENQAKRPRQRPITRDMPEESVEALPALWMIAQIALKGRARHNREGQKPSKDDER